LNCPSASGFLPSTLKRDAGIGMIDDYTSCEGDMTGSFYACRCSILVYVRQ